MACKSVKPAAIVIALGYTSNFGAIHEASSRLVVQRSDTLELD